ncbi:hypothetical protein [Demequina gelatinilytica]|uniref:hypothetical protein n=1 Tax=Demequina gelatinilytica TaxID=1638980 RepID=UPI000AFB11F8|nr:hypothetical protein [Demequina gelatinilytica]
MFTVTLASASTLSASAGSFEPGFYLMIALVLAGITGTVTVAIQNHHRKHR